MPPPDAGAVEVVGLPHRLVAVFVPRDAEADYLAAVERAYGELLTAGWAEDSAREAAAQYVADQRAAVGS